jgi:hypothetical protein
MSHGVAIRPPRQVVSPVRTSGVHGSEMELASEDSGGDPSLEQLGDKCGCVQVARVGGGLDRFPDRGVEFDRDSFAGEAVAFADCLRCYRYLRCCFREGGGYEDWVVLFPGTT